MEKEAMAHLLSVNVGLPRDIAWRGKTVHTAVWKEPVQGRRMARRLNIDGDGQGDLAGHGGEHRAVFVYQIDSYRYWQDQLGRADLSYGQFGENFTVDGLSDDAVCIGDRYRIGGAVLEVTQPRVTCYRVGIRMNEPQMAALLVAHDRPGFYFRVIEEGEVGAGDEIVQVAAGPERVTIAEVNALLYKPGHPKDRLEQALRIPALSAGWRASFQALLERTAEGGVATGNPGLAPGAGPAPGWTGFRPLQVSQKDRESSNVTSLTLEPADGKPLATALPGQFVVLRLRPAPDAPVLLRSYSLSGDLSASRYRVSIKREPHGAAGAYIETAVQVGDVLDVSAPRGSFWLQPGDGPVVLLSAGVGATPVLAMLRALAASASPREVWWIYGARDGAEHPFAAETRTLLEALPRGHRHICYSAPGPADRPAVDFDAAGRLSLEALQALALPHDADFYLCGPPAFMSDLTSGLAAWGVAGNRIHSEIFGSGPSTTPGIVAGPKRPPHLPDGPAGTGPLVSFARSSLNIRWDTAFNSLLELAEACDVPVRWSCRTGVCHTCETGLIVGAVAYQPDPVEPPADGDALICCSQPRGDIVIDL
jgi:ferredoxin-NADP reductase/MOSC domain-containing protein YiiM/ferredoxin